MANSVPLREKIGYGLGDMSSSMFFAYIGSFIAMGIFWLFERSVPGGSVGNATPMQWTGVVSIIAFICAVLFIGCFALTRECGAQRMCTRRP